MKLFISQPMSDKTNEEIEKVRAECIELVKKKLGEENVEVIDTFFKDAPHDAKPLYFLGHSIQLLGEADVAYFAKGWEEYRGCRVEHKVAEEYGIKIICNDECKACKE